MGEIGKLVSMNNTSRATLQRGKSGDIDSYSSVAGGGWRNFGSIAGVGVGGVVAASRRLKYSMVQAVVVVATTTASLSALQYHLTVGGHTCCSTSDIIDV